MRFEVGTFGRGLTRWMRKFEEGFPDELDKDLLDLMVLDVDAGD